MAILREVQRPHRGFGFICPGCKTIHYVSVEGPQAWGFNGSETKPTFTPSVLIRARGHDPDTNERIEEVCHFFVVDGQIQYLPDCTHDLRATTVPIPELPIIASE